MKGDWRSWVEANLSSFKVPGAVVAVISGDEADVFPFGSRGPAAGAVTEDTAFSIASCSKAFTALASAMLVGDGQIAFDDPVCGILPELQLDDPSITARVTLRDLLAMRVGLLGVGLYSHGCNRNVPVATVLGRVRHLPRIAGFGETFTYLNQAYLAVAEIVARRSGQPFASFVKDRIFDPLGFEDAFVEEGIPKSGNVALPHALIDGQVRVLPEALRHPGHRGASCVFVSGRDALRWLHFHLSGRAPAGDALVPEPIRQQLYADQVTAALPATLGQTFQTYCMGWLASDFRGRRILHHEGGSFGVRSHTIVCPAEGFAVAVYATLPSPEAVKSTTYGLLDRACGASAVDWAQRFRSIEQQMLEANITALDGACPIDARVPTAQTFAGVYENPANGRMTLVEHDGEIEFRFADAELFNGWLQPLGGDVYKARCAYPAVADGLYEHLRMRLSCDAAGRVVTITIPSMAAVFSRVQ